jgi:hypothetical protein
LWTHLPSTVPAPMSAMPQSTIDQHLAFVIMLPASPNPRRDL